MTRPAENQQTVEAALARADEAFESIQRSSEPFDLRPFQADLQDARAVVRDLAAQAQEWKQLAEDMGEALRSAHDPERWSDFLTMQVDALLARLHDLAAEQDAA